MFQTIFILASDVWQSVHLLQVDRERESLCVYVIFFLQFPTKKICVCTNKWQIVLNRRGKKRNPGEIKCFFLLFHRSKSFQLIAIYISNWFSSSVFISCWLSFRVAIWWQIKIECNVLLLLLFVLFMLFVVTISSNFRQILQISHRCVICVAEL